MYIESGWHTTGLGGCANTRHILLWNDFENVLLLFVTFVLLLSPASSAISAFCDNLPVLCLGHHSNCDVPRHGVFAENHLDALLNRLEETMSRC